ncbi:hypothetical protein PYCCODRAFT_696131 [Trametes coccinea BRFM310]|uniref:Uncharacterized protein n=1 Tax=Trametes coccinea (strain BRFM310) TaxID=1353009 RepID=A0A1Y2IIH9_TRAC3|nr:hypothetical protein PYCCODRAFT_696131 [Trametes coccinea BRFM310]
MAASVCSYAAPSYSYEQRQNIGASDDHHPQDSFPMPKIHGDVFLFSPSLCSRLSQESTSQSSSSFDPLSYICSPADNNPLVRISSPSALISSASPGSPAPANGLFATCDTKPLTRLSPGTPFERLFDSSPGGFWHADDVFISPISRGSAILGNLQYGSDEDAEGEDDDDGEAPITGKIESLLAYGKSHGLSDSPRTVRSPSSLSSLSSRSSSPSVALSALRLPSSQTSRSATMLCSPSAKAASTSPLASPVKSCTQSPPAPVDAHFVRRSRRLRSTTRYNGRVLGTEILNQQAQARDASAGEYETSPLKLSSSPAPSLCDSDDENYVPADRPTRRTRKRARQSRQSSPSLRTKKRRISEPTAVPEAVRVRVSSQPSSPDDTDAAYSTRTFPLSLPIHENFPLFYRRFPVSSVIDAELAAYALLTLVSMLIV